MAFIDIKDYMYKLYMDNIRAKRQNVFLNRKIEYKGQKGDLYVERIEYKGQKQIKMQIGSNIKDRNRLKCRLGRV